MRYLKRFIVLGCFCSLFSSAIVSAQSRDSLYTLDTNRYNTLSTVKVVAERMVKEVMPVQVLSGAQLQKLSAYSVADAVRYFAGVQIKDYGGIGGLKTVNIRSLGSQHVGVFYDGIELGNAQNGVVDLGRFSLDNMEAISLYNGQKSAIFQPAKDFASANAVYMQTKVPLFAPGKRSNFNFGVKGGSFGTINPSVLWEQKLSERVSLSASTEYMYTNGRFKFTYQTKGGYDTTQRRHNGDVRMERAEVALFGVTNDGEWRVKGYFYDSERGYPGASVREEPGKFRHQDRQWDDNFFLQASWREKISDFYSLMLNGKYAYDYLHYLSDPREDVSTMYVNNHYRQQEGYFSLANLFNFTKWWSASLSNDFQWNKLNADLADFVYPNRYSLYSAVSTSLSLNRLKLQASLLHTFIKDKTNLESSNRSKFTPSAVLSYRPLNGVDLEFRSFYKKVFRMPTFNDLYYTTIGNKSLKPEKATQYDIGVIYRKSFKEGWLRGLEVQLDGYYNIIEDKIVALPTSNQFRWTMLNFGKVKIKGLDALLQTMVKTGEVDWTLRASYTFQRAEDVTDKTSQWYKGQIPYIPRHSGTAVVSADYRGWNFNYSFIYTGERYDSVANIPENYQLPWYTSDIGVSKSFYFGTKGVESKVLRVTLEVNNIFNQQYEVVQCYPMPGTNFKIKLNFIL